MSHDPASDADRARQVASLCEAALRVSSPRGLAHVSVARSAERRLAGLVHASSPEARALIELQETLGEGPSLDALAAARTLLADDVTATHESAAWLMFGREAHARGVRSVYAFPLQIGAVGVGVLTLHGALTAPLDADDMAALLRVRDVLSWVLLTPTISVGDTGIWASLLAPDHAVVNQAAGMVSVQVGCSLADALVRLQAHAVGHDLSLAQVAGDVVARRIRFAPDGGAFRTGTSDSTDGSGED